MSTLEDGNNGCFVGQGQGVHERGTFRCFGSMHICFNIKRRLFLLVFLFLFRFTPFPEPTAWLFNYNGLFLCVGRCEEILLLNESTIRCAEKASLRVSMVHILSWPPPWYVFHNLLLSLYLSVLPTI